MENRNPEHGRRLAMPDFASLRRRVSGLARRHPIPVWGAVAASSIVAVVEVGARGVPPIVSFFASSPSALFALEAGAALGAAACVGACVAGMYEIFQWPSWGDLRFTENVTALLRRVNHISVTVIAAAGTAALGVSLLGGDPSWVTPVVDSLVCVAAGGVGAVVTNRIVAARTL